MRKLRQLCIDQPAHLQIASASRLARCRRHVFKQLDCVLVIEGVDSRFNAGCREFFRWLFPRASNVTIDIPRDISEDTLEDVVTVILPHEVHVICSPVAFYMRYSQICNVPNLHIHRLEDAQWDDAEAIDDFKLQSLIRIFRSLPSSCVVGIPFFPVMKARGDTVQATFDKMSIEKWPLIQAFAAGVDQGGAGEFFTLTRTIVELSDTLERLYVAHFDDADLRFFEEHYPQVDRHINELLQNLDRQTLLRKLNKDELLDSLATYAQADAGNVGHLAPLVAFGAQDTNAAVSEFIERILAAEPLVANNRRADPFMLDEYDDCTPLAFVATMPAMQRNIVCARTYFVAEGVERSSSEPAVDDRLKSRLSAYSELSNAVLAAVEFYSRTGDLSATKQRFGSQLQPVCAKLQCEARLVFVTVDKLGRVGRLQENVRSDEDEMINSLGSKAAFGVLIGCRDELDGSPFGSLIYGDSFVLTHFKWQSSSGDASQDSLQSVSDFAVLTRKVKAFHIARKQVAVSPRRREAVIAERVDCEFAVLLDGNESQDGKRAEVDEEHCELTLLKCASDRDPFIEAKVNGGVLSLRPVDVQRVLFIDGESAEAACCLVLQLDSRAIGKSSSTICCGFSSTESGFLLLLFRRQVAHLKRLLFNTVFGVWKTGPLQDSFRVVASLDGTSTRLSAKFKQLCSTSRDSGNALVSESQRYRRLLNEVALSADSLPLRFGAAERDAFGLVDDDRKADSASKRLKVNITVLHGFAGSYKRELCDVFSRLSSDAESWSVCYLFANHTNRSRNVDQSASVRKQLELAVNISERFSRYVDETTVTRMLLCVQGAANMQSVAAQIDELAVELDRRGSSVKLCISSYVLVLNQDYGLLGGECRPFLLDNCRPNVCDTVVFTGEQQAKERDRKRLDTFLFALKRINSRVVTVQAPRGRLQTEQDLARLCLVQDSEAADSDSPTAKASGAAVRSVFLNKLLHSQPLDVVRDADEQEQQLRRQPSLFRVDFVKLQFSSAFALRRSAIVGWLDKLQSKEDEKNDEEDEGSSSSSSAAASGCGQVLHVSGMVQCVDSGSERPRLFVLSHVTTCRVKQSALTECELVAAGSINAQDMTFVGISINVDVLLSELRRCIEQPSAPKQLLKRSDLTQEDVAKIEKNCRLRELPEGWYYNGSYYVSFDGEKRNVHPQIDEFIEAHLRRVNQEIEAANLRRQSEALDFDQSVTVELS